MWLCRRLFLPALAFGIGGQMYFTQTFTQSIRSISLHMASYKDPSFQDRNNLAKQARLKALEMLKNKPAVDEAVIAERKAAQEKREAAEAAKRAEKRAAMEQAKAEKLAKKLEAAAAADKPVMTEAEKKAERDARYAARKNRKSGR